MRFLSLLSLLTGKNKTVDTVDRIFLGIGNPGEQYHNTRHNIGFAAIDRLTRDFTIVAHMHTATADCRIGTYGGQTCALIKPTTFVNSSGKAMIQAINRFHCPPERCLVIVDDYHLPLGTLRMRKNGSDGGHNGLKSIIEFTGIGFPRLRIGIGPLPQGMPSIDFVLGVFEASESAAVLQVLERANDVMKVFASLDVNAAMNAVNIR
jgi:peptidyl-tRNA hydrolase, PTH1 family